MTVLYGDSTLEGALELLDILYKDGGPWYVGASLIELPENATLSTANEPDAATGYTRKAIQYQAAALENITLPTIINGQIQNVTKQMAVTRIQSEARWTWLQDFASDARIKTLFITKAASGTTGKIRKLFPLNWAGQGELKAGGELFVPANGLAIIAD